MSNQADVPLGCPLPEGPTPNKPRGVEDRESIAYGLVDDLFIVIHLGGEVDENDWRVCFSDFKRAKSEPAMLIVPGEVLPNIMQRHDLVELHETRPMKVAVLSDLTATPRVVTALKWAGIDAAGFAIDDLDGMLAFLEHSAGRARISSAIGPYLERSWLADVTLDPQSIRSANSPRPIPDTAV